MMSRSKVTGMNEGFDALFSMGCRQFQVHTNSERQTITYEVSFWVPIMVGGQNGLSVVVRGNEYDDPFTKAVEVASDLLQTYPRIVSEKECSANAR